MARVRRPYHDERVRSCPICGSDPWVDLVTSTIYCDCGLRYHISGECHPEWHRMEWTENAWNELADAKTEMDRRADGQRDPLEAGNAKLRELARDLYNRCLDKDPCCGECRCQCDHDAWNFGAPNCIYARRMKELGIEVG